MEEQVRMADDSCLFCGQHGKIGGGHLFIGERGQDGNLYSKDGWVCMEHLSTCAIQICPQCASKMWP